jgi:hypothetical protein
MIKACFQIVPAAIDAPGFDRDVDSESSIEGSASRYET